MPSDYHLSWQIEILDTRFYNTDIFVEYLETIWEYDKTYGKENEKIAPYTWISGIVEHIGWGGDSSELVNYFQSGIVDELAGLCIFEANGYGEYSSFKSTLRNYDDYSRCIVKYTHSGVEPKRYESYAMNIDYTEIRLLKEYAESHEKEGIREAAKRKIEEVKRARALEELMLKDYVPE
ncbi:MAG: hypothetical protein ACXAD7_06985 [Candidatus Kariarchaeaceae archaeon]